MINRMITVCIKHTSYVMYDHSVYIITLILDVIERSNQGHLVLSWMYVINKA